MPSDLIIDNLKASHAEQTPVTLHLRSGTLRGVVSRIEEGVVELRQESRRSIVRLDRIEAITVE